jgi:hypothetical protein
MRVSSQNTAPIGELADQLVYQPTDKEKRLKAQFWLKAADNPLINRNALVLEDVRQLLNTEALNTSWPKPGFREWFSNTDEYRERLEYLFGLALDAAEKILQNEDPKAQSARVNMVKAISELAGKMPGKSSSSPAAMISSTVSKMDKAQLELLLQRNGVNFKLSASKDQTIDIEPEKD